MVTAQTHPSADQMKTARTKCSVSRAVAKCAQTILIVTKAKSASHKKHHLTMRPAKPSRPPVKPAPLKA